MRRSLLIGASLAVLALLGIVARDKETAVYSEMHRMINTKIIAEDGQVWGREEITPERCDELIAVVTKGNLS